MRRSMRQCPRALRTHRRPYWLLAPSTASPTIPRAPRASINWWMENAFSVSPTSNGPDVHVYFVAANDASDSETVRKAGFLELGSIKGNIGDQNYDIPADVDLAKYRAVTIWCKRFSVNFGTAPLNSSAAVSTQNR